MKVSKASWLVLISGIFIVVFASLGFTHAQQLQEQGKLDDELATAELRLNKFQIKQFTVRKAELEEQLQQAFTKLEEARETLDQPVTSIIETDALFLIAEACGVTILELSSSGLNSDALADLKCTMLPLAVRAEGEVADLIGFITKLNNDFSAGLVKSADIDIPEPDESSEEGAIPSARIQMSVYTRKGADGG